MSKQFLQIHPEDNVLAALTDLPKGSDIEHNNDRFQLTDKVKAKHKFTICSLKPGDSIFMYGSLVGKATKPIAKGETITTKNVVHASSEYEVGQEKLSWKAPDVSKWKDATFNGYHRADGSVGTANHWLVIPLVFCENRNVDVMKSALLKSLGYHTATDFVVDTEILVDQYKNGASENELLASDIIKTPEEIKQNRTFPNVDGIKFLNHDGGCGGIRQDSETLCNLLAGYITHPNTAGATILSLGCQNAQFKLLEEAIAKRDPNFKKPLYVLEQQKSAGERQFIEEAVKKTFLGLIEANKTERKPAPVSQLVLGLECGGSDGFSGISANPSLGYASDLLVGLGATTVLSEFPELNGVEQELINRCQTEENAEKFAKLMRAYSEKAVSVGSGFENNPSPGNIKDGLITDAMKSAGAAKKGGTSPVTDVLDYTEPVKKKGLNLLCTPGNDVESTTGLAGSGCNVICFTTGLGTPTGNPIAPVIKLSSNNALSERMKDIIDFNTGTVITGEDTIETKGEELLDYIIKVASGEIVPAAVRLGQEDFIPWKRGISL
ncbi:altronate dehydratase family protein [Zobellia galactanivorans]|uniref:UxaA family hydrolase n=1 Tax=Zobellia galactanivorans (strain DSM 12802 / CCUG 47099 / CIP 106680 / NCIMB 13871 / Dsij) TaxID=63186 RepID=UPI001C07936F|nr:altronate dehydratase family protein [Zobellia galactanivorans]MBU3025639.1 altronate dehydratase family protein [Zobellia galactanivorans]MDO6808068.1 altronate dehydratase family protein [Zobellia galactanivorans]